MPISRADPKPTAQPKVVDTHVRGTGKAVAPDQTPKIEAGQQIPATSEPVANAFERANIADVVNAHIEGGAAGGGQNALLTRLQNATGSNKPPRKIDVALNEARGLIPAAGAVGTEGAARLGQFLLNAVGSALAEGEKRAILNGGDLAPLLKPLGVEENTLVEALVMLGYDARESGAMSGGVVVTVPSAGTPQGDKAAFAEALSRVLPSRPGGSSVGAALGTLVAQAIAAAASRGESRASLSTADLDRVLKPLSNDAQHELYDDVAKLLKELGYRSGSDGFVGVGLRWDAPATQQLTAAALADGLGKTLPRAEKALTGPADLVADLVARKIDEAGKRGEARISLSTGELDKILRPAFSSAYEVYGTIAEALKAKGFTASSDGFVGVGARWDK